MENTKKRYPRVSISFFASLKAWWVKIRPNQQGKIPDARERKQYLPTPAWGAIVLDRWRGGPGVWYSIGKYAVKMGSWTGLLQLLRVRPSFLLCQQFIKYRSVLNDVIKCYYLFFLGLGLVLGLALGSGLGLGFEPSLPTFVSSFSVLRGCPSRWYDLGTTASERSELLMVVPKLYQREGQPRKTENEFSHDRLTMIHRQSDDLGNPRWLSSVYFHKR